MKINVCALLISITLSTQALDQLPAELFEQVIQHLVEPLTMRNAFSLFSLEQSSKSLSMQTSVVCQKLLIESNQKASQLLSYAARAGSARALTLVLCNVKPLLESKEVGTIIGLARQLPADDENKRYIQLDEQGSCGLFKVVGSFYPYALYDAENPHLVAKTTLTIIKFLESGNIFPQVNDGKLFWSTVPRVPTLHYLIDHVTVEPSYAAIEMFLKHGANPSYKFNGFDAFDRLKKNAKRSHAEKEQLKELLLGYKRGPVIDTTNIMYPEKN